MKKIPVRKCSLKNSSKKFFNKRYPVRKISVRNSGKKFYEKKKILQRKLLVKRIYIKCLLKDRLNAIYNNFQ